MCVWGWCLCLLAESEFHKKHTELFLHSGLTIQNIMSTTNCLVHPIGTDEQILTVLSFGSAEHCPFQLSACLCARGYYTTLTPRLVEGNMHRVFSTAGDCLDS